MDTPIATSETPANRQFPYIKANSTTVKPYTQIPLFGIKLCVYISLFLVLGCSAKYKWSKADYALAGTTIIAQFGDGYTTDRVVNDLNGYEKTNTLILGKYPSTQRIIIWKAGSTIVIIGIAHIAPFFHPKLRKIILGCTTLSAGYCTWHNYDLIREID